MTHDELLARIKVSGAGILAMQYSPPSEGWIYDKNTQALFAIAELHKPVEITTGVSYTQENGLEVLATQAICAFCKDMGSIEHLYPCPTIQAIEKELE